MGGNQPVAAGKKRIARSVFNREEKGGKNAQWIRWPKDPLDELCRKGEKEGENGYIVFGEGGGKKKGQG